MTVIKKKTGGNDVTSGNLYVVTYACAPKSGGKIVNPLDPFGLLESAAATFNTTNLLGLTVTHGFFLYKGQPTGTPTDFTKSTDMLAVVHVITTDQTATSKEFDNRNCKGSFVVRGSNDLNLLGYYGTSNTAATKLLAGTATFLTTSVSALTPLIAGTPLAAGANDAAASGSKLINAFSSFLALFDSSNKKAVPLPIDTEGEYRIDTPLSRVTVRVSQVDGALVDDKNADFQDGLANLYASGSIALNLTVTAASTEKAPDPGKCELIAGKWFGVGVVAPIDLAYVLYTAALNGAALDKDSLISCLGPDRARAVVESPNSFRVASAWKFDEDDIDRVFGMSDGYGPQPPADKIKKHVSYAIDLLNGEADPKFVGKYFAEEVDVTDGTRLHRAKSYFGSSIPFGKDGVAGTAEDITTLLGEAGFGRWSCPISVTDAENELRSPGNEPAVLVAWRAGLEDKISDTTTGFAVRLFFRDGKVAGIMFDDHKISPKAVIAAATAKTCPEAAGFAKVTTASSG